MAQIMWACWDGGGNLTPSIGIARALEERGHDVHFFGRPEMVPRLEACGLMATEELLNQPRFRAGAARRSLAFAGLDGAQLAADSVEAVLSDKT